MNVSNLVRKELFQMRWILIVGMLFGLALAILIVVTFLYVEQVVAEIPPDLMELDYLRQKIFKTGGMANVINYNRFKCRI